MASKHLPEGWERSYSGLHSVPVQKAMRVTCSVCQEDFYLLFDAGKSERDCREEFAWALYEAHWHPHPNDAKVFHCPEHHPERAS